MFPALALNILAISLIGFIASYTDLRFGRISNRLVFTAAVAAFALNFLNAFPLLPFLANGLFAFIFGFLLFAGRLWSAGDSKLFLAFALLFPLHLLPQQFSPFPAFSILINSFVPAFLILLLFVLFKTSAKQKKQALAQTLSPKSIASVAIFLFSFYWLLHHAFTLAAIQLDFFSTTLILFLLVAGLEFLLPEKTTWLFSLLALLFLAINNQQVLTPEFLIQFLSWLLLFIFLIFFVIRLGLLAFGKKVPLNKLKPGMLLLDSVIEKGNVLKRREAFYPSLINMFLAAREPRLIPSGEALSAEQVKMLQARHQKHQTHFDALLVQETLPFAAILFAGVLITLALAFL